MTITLEIKWTADGSLVTVPYYFWLGAVIEAANASENMPLPYIARSLSVGVKHFACENEAREWVVNAVKLE